MYFSVLFVPVIWSVLEGTLTMGLQCHRCIYTNPHNEDVKAALEIIQANVAGFGYNVPSWKSDCQSSPMNDLSDTLTLPGPLLTKHEALKASLSILSQITRHEPMGPINIFRQDGDNKTFELQATKAITQFCYEFNVRAKFEGTDLEISLVYRDGVMLDLNDEARNKCYDGLDEILNVVGGENEGNVRKIVQEIQACTCNEKDGCNGKDFKVDGGQGTKLEAYKLIIVITAIMICY